MDEFNINGCAWVKLTERGKEIHRENHERLFRSYPEATIPYFPPPEDAEGWSQWHLWDLMSTFGRHIYLGCVPPFETTIRLGKK